MIRNNEKVEIDLGDLRFIYFGRKTKSAINRKGDSYTKHFHKGVVCVGYSHIELDEKPHVVFGFSFCSPQNHFSRGKAKADIGERINDRMNIVVEVGQRPTYEQVVNLAKGLIIASYPEGIDIREVERTPDCPKIGDVRFPRWFSPEVLQ